MKDLLVGLDFEHKMLFILGAIAYVFAMIAQTIDKNTNVNITDWFLAALISPVGGIIMYNALIGWNWNNVGLRMGFTIFASLYSYRLFKFVVSNRAQTDVIEVFWGFFMGWLKKFVNIKGSKDGGNNTGD